MRYTDTPERPCRPKAPPPTAAQADLFRDIPVQVFSDALRLRGLSQDLLGELWVRCYDRWGAYSPALGSVTTWVGSQTRGLLRDLSRPGWHHTNRVYKDVEPVCEDPTPRSMWWPAVSAKLLQRERQILSAVIFDGDTIAQKAKALGVTKQRGSQLYISALNKARRVLR